MCVCVCVWVCGLTGVGMSQETGVQFQFESFQKLKK